MHPNLVGLGLGLCQFVRGKLFGLSFYTVTMNLLFSPVSAKNVRLITTTLVS